jgi:uncharacterized protein (TIGR02284 family)
MEQYPENYAKQLERLLTIVNDGKEGYKKASEHAHSPELKDLLMRYSEERAQMSGEIKEKLRTLGGHTENQAGDNAGFLHRAMMAFKTAITKDEKDDQAVLETCRTGDQAALETFDDILQGSILNSDLKAFITNQRYKISQAYYEMDKLYFQLFKTSPEW